MLCSCVPNLPPSLLYILTDGWGLYTQTHTRKHVPAHSAPAAAVRIKVRFDGHCPQRGALCRHVPSPLQSRYEKSHCAGIKLCVEENMWNMWLYLQCRFQEPAVSRGPSHTAGTTTGTCKRVLVLSFWYCILCLIKRGNISKCISCILIVRGVAESGGKQTRQDGSPPPSKTVETTN